MQATSVLLGVNLLFICMVVFLQDLGNMRLLLLILGLATLLSGIPYLLLRRPGNSSVSDA